MRTKRFLRYLAPNLVTALSIVFGLMSIAASISGQYYDAAWFVLFSVLADKIDGLLARLLNAATKFGVQMDSLADFLSFGVAPAVMWFAYFSTHSELPFEDGRGYAILSVSCIVWVLCVTVRLARYNVVEEDPRCRRLFFGVPTTLMAGVYMTMFLTMLKYPGNAEFGVLAAASFDEPHLFGGVGLSVGVWRAFPLFILAGALLMISSAKIPKLGISRYKAVTIFVFANVLLGYGLSFARTLPEVLFIQSGLWLVLSLAWGVTASSVRGLRAPSIFPKRDLAPHERPLRPEDDLFSEDDEAAAASEVAADGNDDEPARAPR